MITLKTKCSKSPVSRDQIQFIVSSNSSQELTHAFLIYGVLTIVSLFVIRIQIFFTGTTEQIKAVFDPLWEAISDFIKQVLTFNIGMLAMAVDREDQDGCLHVIEIIFSAAFRDPTFEQSSAAASFISLLRRSSIATLNEIKELAQHYLDPTVTENTDNQGQVH